MCTYQSLCPLPLRYEYEFSNATREDMKRTFTPTMEFVEEYLKEVVNSHYPFANEEKNELTLEVKFKRRKR